MSAKKHPEWCAWKRTDPRRCAERGEHRSVQVAITATGDELVGLRLGLVELTEKPASSFALLTFADDGKERDYPITFGQLRVLGLTARRFYARTLPKPTNEGPAR